MSLMGDFRRILGLKGEDLACKFLRKKGLKVLERNFRTDMGEIDIVAMDGETVVFVEVKTRTRTDKGWPEEAVDRDKLRKIEASGRVFLRYLKMPYKGWRIDIISIENTSGSPKITRHIEGV
ncbi:MAG: YraN family protein [Planctomycetota bacterium]